MDKDVSDASRVLPEAPWLDGGGLLGHLSEFAGDPLGFMIAARARAGDVLRFRVGSMVLHLVADPDSVGRILQRTEREYGKESRGYTKLRQFLGDGLLTSDGAPWARRRQLVQPSFHRDRLREFVAVMAASAGRLARELEALPDGTVVDVAEKMTALTLDVAARCFFGADIDPAELSRIGDAVGYGNAETIRRVNSVLDFTDHLPTPRNVRFILARRTIDRIVMRLVAERRRHAGQYRDVLALLVEARDEDGRPLDDRELRDEVVTLLLAGHETTASTLAWMFHLMSTHVDVARKADEEIARVLGDREPTFDDVASLEYLGRIGDETLRLYPPAWVIGRSAATDEQLGGHRIPKGSEILVSPWVIHRHPNFYPNPEGFDPDRFKKDESRARHRFAYLPFGAGPRTCIGNHFALTELRVVVATLRRVVQFERLPGVQTVPEPLVTLRPKGGLPMAVRAVRRRRSTRDEQLHGGAPQRDGHPST